MVIPETEIIWRKIIKFALDQNEAGNIIRSCAPGKIQIRNTYYESCLLVGNTELHADWPLDSVEALTGKDLAPIVEMQPQILLIGTGSKQIFPQPRIFIPLMDANIGYEIMDTAAACRTYNVLLSEDRKVLALLFP